MVCFVWSKPPRPTHSLLPFSIFICPDCRHHLLPRSSFLWYILSMISSSSLKVSRSNMSRVELSKWGSAVRKALEIGMYRNSSHHAVLSPVSTLLSSSLSVHCWILTFERPPPMANPDLRARYRPLPVYILYDFLSDVLYDMYGTTVYLVSGEEVVWHYRRKQSECEDMCVLCVSVLKRHAAHQPTSSYRDHQSISSVNR